MLLENTHANEAATRISYDRTVSRSAVNRQALSEVFLTDFIPLDEHSGVCGAQLPLYHAYYTDHLARPQTHDLLLLLECCRQAGTYSGYTLLGNSADTVNIVREMKIEITAPNKLVAGDRPGELALHVTVVDKVVTRHNKRATLSMEMLLDGAHIGQTHIHGTTVPKRTFRALRQRRLKSEPPLTSGLPETPEGEPVAPFRVGRQHPLNVVLTDVVTGREAATARLGVPSHNRSILDHAYDHFPAMALLEATRQVGLVAMEPAVGGVGCAAARMRATRLRASFARFAELDTPVTLRARMPGVATASDGEATLAVECRQETEPAVTAEITFTRLP